MGENAKADKPEPGLLDFWWGGSGEASQKAWSLWESVKSSPAVQQAQQQAQAAWQNYDQEAVRERLASLGKSATIYIDEADRRLESMELGALHYLQQRSTELVDRVKEATLGEQRDGEVLFSGAGRTHMSRLDSELLALDSSPDEILAANVAGGAAAVAAAQREKYLAESPQLQATYRALVPQKLTSDRFWDRYATLRAKLEEQDRHRKQLIMSQPETDSAELDDWGSSDDEERGEARKSSSRARAGSPRAEASDAARAATPSRDEIKKSIEEEGSDSDWE